MTRPQFDSPRLVFGRSPHGPASTFSAPESFYTLACLAIPAEYLLSGVTRRHERIFGLYCLRCNQELDAGQKSVAVYMFAQTVGIRPRQKSGAHRICFCPPCSVSLAMGPPPEGALNLAAWQMIRDLVSSDPALNHAAWDDLRETAALVPADGNSRRAVAGGYLEF